MFSTLMSLEDRLKAKIVYGYNAEPPIAIPIYTVLPYCVIKCTSLEENWFTCKISGSLVLWLVRFDMDLVCIIMYCQDT